MSYRIFEPRIEDVYDILVEALPENQNIETLHIQ
jgi:hypothetical protein